ncbi:MAG: DUF4337 domain-containing protein [Proteobacteria bacterium]|nr:DUF4337 domain-containing protein [Pseudomonadota bacterium]
MDIEPGEAKDKKLTNITALSVVLFSVFMAIQGIKAGNIAQGIDQTKADIVNKWNQYQAARLKHDISESAIVTNNLFGAVPGVDPNVVKTEREKAERANAIYTEREKKYSAEAKELQVKLEELSKKDDQFDVAEALLTMGVAIAAVAILAESWWLLALSWIFGSLGMTLGAAAMRGINLNPQWLVDLIT